MEQRTASKHVGNVPTALNSCQMFIGPGYEADFLLMLILVAGICCRLFYWRGVFADGPLGPSALTLGNWMLLSQNG